jgi:CRISPR-associated protein Csh1
MAFKREHLDGGAKYIKNANGKKQIYERFGDYFNKAFALFKNSEDAAKYEIFKQFFLKNEFSSVLFKNRRIFIK